MDVELKPPALENGNEERDFKNESTEDSEEKVSPEASKIITRQKQKRSRSRTPTSKAEESKTLHINLTKLDEEVNGNENDNRPDEHKSEANVEQENASKDEPITKRTRHQKELATQDATNKEENEKNLQKKDEKNLQKKENEKNLQKTLSPRKGSPNKGSPNKGSPKKNSPKKESANKDLSKNEVESESIEMEPLVISDEQEPELQFDEISDKESGKGSPVIQRCVTRRSLTRNIPTPKTPKPIEQDVDVEHSTTTAEQGEAIDLPKNEDDTNESSNSNKAEVGSDETRLEYVDKNVTLSVDDTYLQDYREKSLTETIRCLSARKPIRDVYRNRTFRVQDKSDLDAPFCNRQSVELTSSGTKRKDRSLTPEDAKKFKSDTSSFFTSPLASLRDKFRLDPSNSSTPLLRGYKDSRTDLHFDEKQQTHMLEDGLDDKKNWCSLM